MDVSVDGISMEPLLKKGDSIFVKYQSSYSVGDIVLFDYADEGLLVHRILRVDDDLFFCKGDNSFRLELISYDSIIGKVLSCNGEFLKPLSMELICLSYEVGRLFKSNKFSKKLTIQSAAYCCYKEKLISFLETINEDEII